MSHRETLRMLDLTDVVGPSLMGSLVYQLLCAGPNVNEMHAMRTEMVRHKQWFRLIQCCAWRVMELGGLDSEWICTDLRVLELQFEGKRSPNAADTTDQGIVPEKLFRQLVKWTKLEDLD
ncbi:hypothetical protein BGZ81_009574 [Podila clonocystis]|nr:hypothetical protein BGZ81_009574 [Podila clonocystis]